MYNNILKKEKWKKKTKQKTTKRKKKTQEKQSEKRITVDLYKTSRDSSACKHKLVIQSAFTCSKLTIETLEQGVKYVQS